MLRIGSVKKKAFSGKVTNLTNHMLSMPSTVPQEVANPSTSQPSGAVSKKRTKDPKPTKKKAKKAKKQTNEAPLPQMSQPTNINVDVNEVVNQEQRDHMERAATTVSTSEGVQDSGTGNKTQSMATQDTEMPFVSSTAEDQVDINVSSGPRCQETTLGASDAQTRSGTQAAPSNDPLIEVNTSGNGEDSIKFKKLTDFCTLLAGEIRELKERIENQDDEIKNLKKLVHLLIDEREKRIEKAKAKSADLKRIKKVGTHQKVLTSSSSESSESDKDRFEFTGAGMGSNKLSEEEAHKILAEEMQLKEYNMSLDEQEKDDEMDGVVMTDSSEEDIPYMSKSEFILNEEVSSPQAKIHDDVDASVLGNVISGLIKENLEENVEEMAMKKAIEMLDDSAKDAGVNSDGDNSARATDDNSAGVNSAGENLVSSASADKAGLNSAGTKNVNSASAENSKDSSATQSEPELSEAEKEKIAADALLKVREQNAEKDKKEKELAEQKEKELAAKREFEAEILRRREKAKRNPTQSLPGVVIKDPIVHHVKPSIPEAVEEALKEKAKGKKPMEVPEKKKKISEKQRQEEAGLKAAQELADQFAREDAGMVSVDIGDGIKMDMTKAEQEHFDHMIATGSHEAELASYTPEQKLAFWINTMEDRRKHFSRKATEAKRNKPLTQKQFHDLMARTLKNIHGGYLKDWKAMDFDVLKRRYEKFEKTAEEGKKKVEEEKARMAAAGHVKELTAEEKELERNRQARRDAIAELGRQEKEKLDEIKKNVSKTAIKYFKKRTPKPAEEEMSSEMPTSSVPVQSAAEGELNVDEMTAMISIDDRLKEPLAVKFPIIAWGFVEDEENRFWLRIKRSNGEEEKFRSFYACARKYSRDDLDDMWAIAQKKMKEKDTLNLSVNEDAACNHLYVLYEQDPEHFFYKKPLKVSMWQCFTHNGLHMVHLENGLWGFFFIGIRYPWTILQLRSMLSINLRCDDMATAHALVEFIKGCYREEIAKAKAEIERTEKQRHDEMVKKFAKGMKR